MSGLLPPRGVLLPWLALLALLGLTLGGAFLPLGAFNTVLALAIAAAKTTIVIFVFMKLARGPALSWAFAGAGLFWLMMLFSLAMIDHATRAR